MAFKDWTFKGLTNTVRCPGLSGFFRLGISDFQSGRFYRIIGFRIQNHVLGYQMLFEDIGSMDIIIFENKVD